MSEITKPADPALALTRAKITVSYGTEDGAFSEVTFGDGRKKAHQDAAQSLLLALSEISRVLTRVGLQGEAEKALVTGQTRAAEQEGNPLGLAPLRA